MIDGIRAYNVQTNIKDNYANIDGITFRRHNTEGFYMNGSLHRFHNKGQGNADDYRFTDLVETINRLKEELFINPEITQISRLEFGVNIKLPYDAFDVTNNIILFKNRTGEYSDIGRIFRFSDYEFKVYNKSYQQKKTENILRVEVRVTKMRHLRNKNIEIRTLSDLLNIELLNGLRNTLLDAFKDCLILNVSEQRVNDLNTTERLKLAEYTNPLHWGRLMRESNKNITREKDKCKQFINEIGGTNLKDSLFDQINDKCDYLLNFSELKSVRNFQPSNKQINSEVSEISYLDDSGKTLQLTQELNIVRCEGCGAVIPNPRKGQKFCSAKEVGEKNAHRCRNIVSNRKHNTIRSIKNVLSIPLIFDLRDMIDTNKVKYLDTAM